jgi:micrococcal nuclease
VSHGHLARPARGALLALLVVTATACAPPPAPTTHAIPGAGRGLAATVSSVIDGDTVELVVGGQHEQVRLLGIDTPETVHPSKPVECWGPEASALARRLLPPGTEVLVQRDQEARDRYGRLLTYLWRGHDHLFVNRALVAEGAARTLSIAPNTSHRATLAAAEHEARSGRLGRWGACPAEPERG